MSLFSKLILKSIVLSALLPILLSIDAYSSENSILDERDHAFIKRLGVSSEDYINSCLRILKEENLNNKDNIPLINIALKCLNITKPEYLEARTNAALLNLTILDYLTAYKIAQQKNIDIKSVSSDEIKAEHLGYNLSQYYTAQRVSEKLGIDISKVTFQQINEENRFIQSTNHQFFNDSEKKFLHGITKVDDFTYYQNLQDMKARLMMERLDNNNVERWKKFASNETKYGFNMKSSSIRSLGATLAGYPQDGAGHFEKVIDLHPFISGQINNNQIWIAYISDDFDISPQNLNYDRWEKSILYCMTVVTSPEALITSHMGISKTTHGVAKKFKGNSINLHRFAAKIMLSLNRERRFMINAPAWVMESIIADALPEGFHAGTREMKAVQSKINNMSFEEWLSSVEGIIQKNKLLRTFQYSDKDQRINTPTYGEGNEIENKELKDALKKSFDNRHTYVERKGGKQETLNNFLEHHPPIISLGHKGTRIGKEMIIYDNPLSQDIFLKISFDNHSTYDWIFSDPFQAAGDTHYVAVDLLKLAQQS